jgi:anti-sigma B factor antagonist
VELLVDTAGDVTVVTVQSEFLDGSNIKRFKERMGEILPTVRHLLLDLHAVSFVDSSGLAAMLTCLKQMGTSGGDMKVCTITSPVRALFDLVRMNKIVQVCKTREEALAAFAADRG